MLSLLSYELKTQTKKIYEARQRPAGCQGEPQIDLMSETYC